MSENVIGVRELQKNTSRLIRSVQEGSASYRISVQGRPTDVVLTLDAQPRSRGATVAELLASPLYRPKDPAVVADQLAIVEAGRDASGRVGEEGR